MDMIKSKRGAVVPGVALLVIVALILFAVNHSPTASVADSEIPTSFTGNLDITLSNGLVNASTDDDYLNDDKDIIKIYVADSDIDDGESISFDATIERELASEDAVVMVTCTIPDKEISGVTADNIAEKTGGEIDLTIDSSGSHSNDNTVYKRVVFSEGTGSQTVTISFEQEETYQDGMEDFKDEAEVNCDADGTSFKALIYSKG